MTKRDRVAVIVPTLGRPRELEVLLASLARQSLRPDAVVLADDTDGDAIARIAKAHGVTYVRNPGPRSAAIARNAGAAHPAARGCGLLMFLDSDAVLEPDYVERITHLLASRPDALGAMGLVVGLERNNAFQNGVAALFGLSRPSRRRAWLSPSLYSLYPLDLKDVTQTNWLWGCNMTVRRAAFDAVGGFHGQFLRYSYLEDLEIGLRILAAHPGGTFLMTPHALLRHSKSPADRVTTLDEGRMRIVHRNLIVRQHMPRRWYRGLQVFWSDVGTVLVKHYRRPWTLPAHAWNLVTTWALLVRYRKDIAANDLTRINRHYRFAVE